MAEIKHCFENPFIFPEFILYVLVYNLNTMKIKDCKTKAVSTKSNCQPRIQDVSFEN